jgi:hypothetical protein
MRYNCSLQLLFNAALLTLLMPLLFNDSCTVYAFVCIYITAKTEATRKQEALHLQLQSALKDAQHAAAATARANDEACVTCLLQLLELDALLLDCIAIVLFAISCCCSCYAVQQTHSLNATQQRQLEPCVPCALSTVQ